MASIYDSLVHQKITVYRPGELEYERSVATSNLLYRFSRPAYVVQPAHSSEVQVIVQEAQTEGLKLTIKGGGHSYAGFSTAKRGILLDLVKMNDVHLDMYKDGSGGTVTVQGGAQWGHAYKKLINGGHDQFVINGGRCPTVGVGGFTLGGGLGPFTRSFGLGCDTVLSATIVNADGELVTATKKQNPDLFWALRGAGGGNFGVLVKMRLEVKKLCEKDVVAGKWVWYPTLFPKPPATDKDKRMGRFIEAMNKFYKASWSNEMTIDSSWLCELDNKNEESPIGVRFLTYYNGNKTAFKAEIEAKLGEPIAQDEILKRVEEASSKNEKAEKSLPEGLIERSLQEPSTLFFHETLVAQWSEEIQKSFPANKKFDFHTSFCFDKSSKFEAITDIIREQFAKFRAEFAGEKGLLQVTFIHAGGKGNEEPKEGTAFYWRAAQYHAYILMEWEEKFLVDRMESFLGRFEAELRPHSMGSIAKYVNFADARLRNPKEGKPDSGLPLPGESYYGKNLERLQDIKAKVDGDNFFRWRQGLLPITAPVKKRDMQTQSDGEEAQADEEKPREDEKLREEAMMAPMSYSMVSNAQPAAVERSMDNSEIRSLTDLARGKEWSNLGRDVSNLTNVDPAGAVKALTDLGF